MLKKRTSTNAHKKLEDTETEYAEIMKKVKAERNNNGKDEEEMTTGKEEELVDNEESNQSVLEEERGDNTEVYSNLKDTMGGI